MTQDEIIHMAREAWGDGKTYNFYSPKHWPEVEEMFVRFATLVAAAEREACAKICEEPWQGHPYDIAKQIRARGAP